MKLKQIVVDENISDKFGVGPRSVSLHDFEFFLHLPQYKLSSPITRLWYKLGRLY